MGRSFFILRVVLNIIVSVSVMVGMIVFGKIMRIFVGIGIWIGLVCFLVEGVGSVMFMVFCFLVMFFLIIIVGV